ncbi:MAG: hypothetical protein HFI20_11675 [Lachnospiraceae bacterium]|nr:hypothetical protein [Lachnospiraceae bacterium]MCI9305882.1 hypothetical protein [Lachnospiraceae bacterium]
MTLEELTSWPEAGFEEIRDEILYVGAELRNKFRFAKHYFIMNVFIYGMKGMTKCKRD